MEITKDELLDALRAAMEQRPAGEEGLTVKELCDTLRKAEEPVRKRLKALIAAGKCEVVRVRRMDMAGRDMLIPGYRFKGAA